MLGIVVFNWFNHRGEPSGGGGELYIITPPNPAGPRMLPSLEHQYFVAVPAPIGKKAASRLQVLLPTRVRAGKGSKVKVVNMVKVTPVTA